MLKLHGLLIVQRLSLTSFNSINAGATIHISFILLIYRDFLRSLLNCFHAIIFNERHFGIYV